MLPGGAERGARESHRTHDADANGRRDDLAEELRKALAKGSDIDAGQFWADLEASGIDYSPKDWWAWAESTDRHVDIRRLEEI